MKKIEQVLNNHAASIGKVVDFNPDRDKLLAFDFTTGNSALTTEMLADTGLFDAWVNEQLNHNQARYGIGGYAEHRTIYNRSTHFDAGDEPRRLHLGVDIWAPAGTPVYNFFDARVHSFAFNNLYGDYGATIILTYTIDGFEFNALYGHLNLDSLNGLRQGQLIKAGEPFAALGKPEENGHWPPHLHFQLILDMGMLKGDYPGVCKFSERDLYLKNSPDPGLILKHSFNRLVL